MVNRRVRSFSTPASSTIRASVSLPGDQYANLEKLAQDQRVSVAWVVRDAVQEYLVRRLPSLGRSIGRTHRGTTKS